MQPKHQSNKAAGGYTVTNELVRVALVGVGATAVMDVWSFILRRLGVPTLDYALVGRWAAHVCKGRIAHANITRVPPVKGESPAGWAIHYFIGIAYAILLVGLQGTEWLYFPTWLPALSVGAATVVFALFVMQPAMGAGFAASRTPTPLKNCFRSLANHTVFGFGLYLSAVLICQLDKIL
ncbi:DUF2938 domain-containing protein [Pseudomonas syringae]|nr:DUF2938 domain-containing protein [Pseudomonas syringae]